MKHSHQKLRWGYSTGACAAAAATAAWTGLARGVRPASVRVRFPDGRDRELPLRPGTAHMAAIVKDGGDDPDCTHGATLYADIRPCRPDDMRAEDYALTVGGGLVILRAVEGIGLCTRQGLDCDAGRWAINPGPRRMITDNLRAAGLNAGCWLLEVGVENGARLAKHTLNAQLGIVGGLSLLGTTGLVQPYSHDAYIHTIDLCVRSHARAGASAVVFCTGGRSRAGASIRLPHLPPGAFVPIGDFIAESLAAACRFGMRDIAVACMPGKLCKYAAGFANTHARRASQDMKLLRAETARMLPEEKGLHQALGHSASVREALLSIPEPAREGLLRRLARTALGHFARRCGGGQALRLLLFDFQGEFMLEESRP
ncbi:MAG: cobalt-precorrin-5B (C(1))-methyltransferase [Desulfovibrionaceae bacterium]|nr:cobalt-precorrin-5B (C(1))-methyltransferase [Desulfovibrionaceae bacterium]